MLFRSPDSLSVPKVSLGWDGFWIQFQTLSPRPEAAMTASAISVHHSSYFVIDGRVGIFISLASGLFLCLREPLKPLPPASRLRPSSLSPEEDDDESEGSEGGPPLRIEDNPPEASSFLEELLSGVGS